MVGYKQHFLSLFLLGLLLQLSLGLELHSLFRTWSWGRERKLILQSVFHLLLLACCYSYSQKSSLNMVLGEFTKHIRLKNSIRSNLVRLNGRKYSCFTKGPRGFDAADWTHPVFFKRRFDAKLLTSN